MRFKKRELFLLFSSTLAGLIVSVFFLEFYFQKNFWHDVNTQFDPRLGWAPVPGQKTVVNGKTFTGNSLGFRSEEVDPRKKQVLIVGDSVAWGVDVDDKETLAYYLSQKSDPKLQVLNWAVSGYGPDQYYLSLQKHIDKARPFLIVVVICTGNDLNDILADNRYGKSKPMFIVEENAAGGNSSAEDGIPPGRYRLRLINDNISRYSCFNLFSRSWLLSYPFFKPFREKYCKSTALSENMEGHLILGLLEKFADLAASRGSRLLFVLSPSKTDFKYRNVFEFMRLGKAGRISLAEASNKRGYLVFENIFAGSSYRHIDYFKTLLDEKAEIDGLFLDDVHYTPAGNRRLAETLRGAIKLAEEGRF